VRFKEPRLHETRSIYTSNTTMAAVRNRVNANGNGTAVQPTNPAAKDYPKENIFLFIPNLIGVYLPCTPRSSR
jgi:hypothetical protein